MSEVDFLLIMNKNYLIAIQGVLIACFISVTMKSLRVSVPPSGVFNWKIYLNINLVLSS